MRQATIRYKSNWMDRVEPGVPFRMHRGAGVKDRISQRQARELKKYLTVKDVAAEFGVAPLTVYGWISDKKLEEFRLPGGQIRITPEAIEAMKRAGKSSR